MGRRNPGPEPVGAGSEAHQISLRFIQLRRDFRGAVHPEIVCRGLQAEPATDTPPAGRGIHPNRGIRKYPHRRVWPDAGLRRGMSFIVGAWLPNAASRFPACTRTKTLIASRISTRRSNSSRSARLLPSGAMPWCEAPQGWSSPARSTGSAHAGAIDLTPRVQSDPVLPGCAQDQTIPSTRRRSCQQWSHRRTHDA